MILKKISPNEAGQRFDKYLKKLLREAPDSFLYKMLRKKNIVRTNYHTTLVAIMASICIERGKHNE